MFRQRAIVCDYTIGRDATDYILVVMFDQVGAVYNVTSES
jgi:hypothetical protein